MHGGGRGGRVPLRAVVGGVALVVVGAALALLLARTGRPGPAAGSPAARSSSSRGAPSGSVAVGPASAAQQQAILAAYERHVGVAAGDAAVQPGSLYLARLTTSGTTWAVAQFEPTSQASAEDEAAGPPFAGGTVPSRPDPLVAIQPGAVTFEQQATGPWAVVGQGGVDWPCRGALPDAVWAAWHVAQSVRCRAERSTPLTVVLPDGTYYGAITAVQDGTGGAGTVTFDPETIAADGSGATDRLPYTYRIATGPATTFETSTGYNPGSAVTADQPWTSATAAAVGRANAPNTLNGTPWSYAVTVRAGAATSIKEYDAVTPSCGLSGTDEPTSPTDDAPTVVRGRC